MWHGARTVSFKLLSKANMPPDSGSWSDRKPSSGCRVQLGELYHHPYNASPSGVGFGVRISDII